MQPFTLLIKPSGSDCNLDCKYCFYKNRAPEIGSGRQRMSGQVLEKLIADYMRLGFPHAGFSWQGGEPMLMGLDFYQRAVELQKKYGKTGQTASNALQTNAVLIDENWAPFLRENHFLVGISIDGPKEFHDYYRVDHAGNGTFDRVIKAIDICTKHNVQFNLLTLVNSKNADHPEQLFDFLTSLGTRYIQFIPCVELDPSTNQVADFSVTPQQYGEFLCTTFDCWQRYGTDRVSIRDFDSILSYCLSGRHTICTFGRRCSEYIVVEHTGDCYPCDFFVEPKWHLGNIFETPIDQLAAGERKRRFARAKQNLPGKCLTCRHLDVCRGGCMKDKNATDPNWTKETYFCRSYKRFFDYTMPKFMQIAARLAADSKHTHPAGSKAP